MLMYLTASVFARYSRCVLLNAPKRFVTESRAEETTNHIEWFIALKRSQTRKNMEEECRSSRIISKAQSPCQAEIRGVAPELSHACRTAQA